MIIHSVILQARKKYVDMIYLESNTTEFIFFNIFKLYNIVLVLPYINMHPPRVYTCSPS